MQHKRKEISDKIKELFSVANDDFNPSIHYPLADEIIQGIDRPITHFFKLSDVFELNSPNIDYKRESDRIGEYFIEHLGRFKNSDVLGYFPKIEISYWKNKVFRDMDYKFEKLSMAYEGDTVKGICLYERMPFVLTVGKFRIGLIDKKYYWMHKR